MQQVVRSLITRALSGCLAGCVALTAVTVTAAEGLGVTPPDAFRVPDGFTVDLVYEVPAKQQGSWVSLTIDPQGRLVACDQYGSLYRVTNFTGDQSAKVEKLNVDMGAAQGLLFAFDSLYVNVNDQSGKRQGGVYRLRDTDGDDQFDQVDYIVPLNNGGEHGPHAMLLSPDGKRIVMCAGNITNLPKEIADSRVPRVWDEDHLLGRMPDARGHNAGRMAPGGYVCSFDPDGGNLELIATGFRNQYDIAFNNQGELFTYDADMEWDVGTPWYRPTRVNHVISGAEFGWRNGTGKWPAYYPDSFGAAVDIGPGSPTGICFGTGAKFPAKYQRALFISDWSYGNIFAVHLEADGSTYGGSYETFAAAAPLPVTDLIVHPEDGALYFTIGGRRTQSGLYRIRYTGDADVTPAEPLDNAAAVTARNLRHELEAFHSEQLSEADSKAAIDLAVAQLGNADRAIRFAARTALEHQPVAAWKEQVLALDDDWARIQGIVAMARTGKPADQPAAMAGLLQIDWTTLPVQGRLDLLRAYGLTFMRLGDPSDAQRQQVIAQLGGQLPTQDNRVNRELAAVLVYIGAPDAIAQTIKLLETAPSQEDQIHYAFILRDQKEGWTDADRRAYFEWFNTAASTRGGMSYGGFLKNIRTAAINTLGDQEKTMLGALLEEPKPRDPMSDLEPRQFVKKWAVADLETAIGSDDHEFDFDRGKKMFAAAQCYKCHRMGISGGILGPDLTGAGGRFSTKDLLTAIIEPNKEVSDQYAATQFLTDTGNVVVGKVINMNGNTLRVLTNLLDPTSIVGVNRDSIEAVRPAPNSMMPAGLIDTLSEEEILDLLAYLRAGGNPEHRLYTGQAAE